jgi:hypothetical protein
MLKGVSHLNAVKVESRDGNSSQSVIPLRSILGKLRFSSRLADNFAIYLLLFSALLVSHWSLLRLPYFWDEAGYYLPAAHDLLTTGSPIPHSVVSNAHPPIVMAFVALAWKLAGCKVVVTRVAMLMSTAFCLLAVFRLAQRLANTPVAIAATICIMLYPVFFAQSTLAMVDLSAAGFIFWALLAYFEDRGPAGGVWFSLAVLTKETAILVPGALFAWEIFRRIAPLPASLRASGKLNTVWLLLPIIPLAVWFAYHAHRTGYIFGNPVFFRYNVQATMQPLRIPLALLKRLWQLLGYMNLMWLTGAALLSLIFRPVSQNGSGIERRSFPLSSLLPLLAIIGIYTIAMAFIGGAVLARYMLPLTSLVILIAISTLQCRTRAWGWVAAVVALGFVLASFLNPAYALEDNLAYRDYLLLHRDAESFMAARFVGSRVMTTWPGTIELSQPWLGFVESGMPVFAIENLSPENIKNAMPQRAKFDLALVFSTQPSDRWLLPDSSFWNRVENLKSRLFGYHRDVTIEEAAEITQGRVVYAGTRHRQSIAIIALDNVPIVPDSAPESAPRKP